MTSRARGFDDPIPEYMTRWRGDRRWVQIKDLPADYGEISVVGNSTETTISVISTPVQVTVFDTNGVSKGTTPDHTNDHITIGTTGVYLVAVSATVNSVAGAASKFEVSVEKNNGATVIIPVVDRNVGGGGTEAGVISLNGLASLTVGDTVEVWLANTTGTGNYVVENMVMSVVQVA